MKHPKAHYQAISKDGFTWSGFWDGLHHFSKEVRQGFGRMYIPLRCKEEDLENGDFEYMVDHGWTRPEPKKRRTYV